MNKKFYVSDEAEYLLKEKGYPFVWSYDSINPNKVTKAEAIDWLEGKGWQFSIMCADNNLYEFIVYFENEHTSGYRETMLEAQDAAIITVLEKL